MGANKMTPEQEYELGQAMLTHEKTIDRSYMSINSPVYYQRPFPNRTAKARNIIKWIFDQPEGSTFLLAEVNKEFSHSTVHNCMKKLEDCRGVTRTTKGNASKSNPKRFTVTEYNRLILQEIMHDG
jgi:hypothetical protein|tara:strand:- start:3099 stop:3476 length:378 start_codon:yes stop_codon:yes gene_type:complete